MLVTRLTRRGIPIETLPAPDRLSPEIVWKLARLIRRARCEIVHCYNPRPMLYGGVAARSLGIRSVLASLSAFACHVPDRSYGFLPQALHTESRRNRWRNRIAVAMARNVVVVSRILGERFFQFNSISPRKLRVISYGVDVNALQRPSPEEIQAFREKIGVCPGEVLVGSVSRLTEQKDYPTQFRAFALAHATYRKMRMAIFGNGPEESRLKSLANELGIADRVMFLGHWDDVPLAMRSLDVFLITSKFEPYGVALLEAKAAGLAIIATEVNEIPELLRGGECGLLSPPQDPERIAECILQLAQDPALRKSLGQRAFEDARVHHSLEVLIEQYQQLYEEIRNS